ncbi:MAG: hypothetical protein ACRDZU_05550 [Acidimicrobiales bacterium]
MIGDDHAEHGVTEELEPLVRRVTGVLSAPRPVDQGGREELGREDEAEALDEPIQARYGELDQDPYSRPTT